MAKSHEQLNEYDLIICIVRTKVRNVVMARRHEPFEHDLSDFDQARGYVMATRFRW
jgi:hypothetical protein